MRIAATVCVSVFLQPVILVVVAPGAVDAVGVANGLYHRFLFNHTADVVYPNIDAKSPSNYGRHFVHEQVTDRLRTLASFFELTMFCIII